MIRVGILGAAGYTGGELIRLLINHPEAEIVFANSESNAGNMVAEVHEGLYGDCDLKFTSEMPFDKMWCSSASVTARVRHSSRSIPYQRM